MRTGAQAPAEADLVLLGAGCDGIEELRGSLDDADDAVRWALLQFNLGAGTLCRKKCVFLHINGANCPVMARGLANEYTAVAQSVLRSGNNSGFHASVEVKHKDDVTPAGLLDRASQAFVADDVGEYSLQWTERHHEQDVRKAAAAAPSADVAANGRGVPGHSSDLRFTAGRDALRAIDDPRGPWSWALFGVDRSLPVVGGGSGSVEEMRECAAMRPSEVLYGVLRMDFGVGRFHRVKHVFVHVVGAEAGVVTRGRATAMQREVLLAVGEILCVSLTFEVASLEDLTVESVVERVRQVAGVHDDEADADAAAKQAFTVEAYRAARNAALSKPAQAAPAHGKSQYADKTIEEVVRLVHAPNSALNWALFGPRETIFRRCRQSIAPAAVPPRRPALGGAGGPGPGTEEAPCPGAREHVAARGERLRGGAAPAGSAGASRHDPAATSGAEARRPDRAVCGSDVDATLTTHDASSAADTPHTAMAAAHRAEAPQDDPPAEAGPATSEAACVDAATGQADEAGPATPEAACVDAATGQADEAAPCGPAAQFSGSLLKMSDSRRNKWYSRYCSIGGGEFHWWHSAESAASGEPPRQRLHLRGLEVAEESDQVLCFRTASSDRTYKFKTNDAHQIVDWVAALMKEAASLANIPADLCEVALGSSYRERLTGKSRYMFGDFARVAVKRFVFSSR